MLKAGDWMAGPFPSKHEGGRRSSGRRSTGYAKSAQSVFKFFVL